MRQKNFYLTLGLILSLILPASLSVARHPFPAAAFEGEAYVIRGGTVVTVTGATIQKGAVVIRNGLIEAVGGEIPIPADARSSMPPE
jgi:hypothetical protein